MNTKRANDIRDQVEAMIILAEAKGWANIGIPHETLGPDVSAALDILKIKGKEIGEDFLISLNMKQHRWELTVFILDNPKFGGKLNEEIIDKE